jgi:hypothetical protein
MSEEFRTWLASLNADIPDPLLLLVAGICILLQTDCFADVKLRGYESEVEMFKLVQLVQ